MNTAVRCSSSFSSSYLACLFFLYCFQVFSESDSLIGLVLYIFLFFFCFVFLYMFVGASKPVTITHKYII